MSQQQQQSGIRDEDMDLIVAKGVVTGMQVKTTFMRQFIAEASQDGTYIIDAAKTLDRIGTAAKFVNRLGVENTIVCSGRQYATTPIEKFCEVVGARHLLGRFMPGTLTNPSLPYYIEPKLVLVSDPQIDEQAVTEATNAGIPVIGIANTDNITSKIDLIIPANNRGRDALAATYWLLAREVLAGQQKTDGGKDPIKYGVDDFEAKIKEEDLE